MILLKIFIEKREGDTMKMTKKFTKEVNGQILYDGIKMELFVPDDFFKSGLAEEVGQSFYLFGSLKAFHYMKASIHYLLHQVQNTVYNLF